LCHSAAVTHGFRTERRPATFVTFALAHGYDVATLFRGAGAGETGADGK
jgi:hypothetical protein